jgi:hypothetical protein
VRQAQARHVEAALLPIIPAKTMTGTKATPRITYRRLAKEGVQRVEDMKSKLFRLNRDHTEYGLSNGDWRDVLYMGKRFVLPVGCTPRKSRRING